MSFIPQKEVPTHNLRRATIANAVGTSGYTIGYGTAIQPGATGHNGFVTLATSTSPVLGVVLGLELNGKISEKNTVVGTNAALGTNSATANVYNDNETNTAPWKVIYIPSNLPIDYVADMSAAVGTTTNSGGLGWLNLIAATTGATGGATLDETSIALFSGTQGQFWSYGQLTEPVANTLKVVGHWSKVL